MVNLSLGEDYSSLIDRLSDMVRERFDRSQSSQTQQVLENLESVLLAAGYEMTDVVKTTCYLSDMSMFADFNDVYARHFKDAKPARATVEVSRLPKDVLVEVDAVVAK